MAKKSKVGEIVFNRKPRRKRPGRHTKSLNKRSTKKRYNRQGKK